MIPARCLSGPFTFFLFVCCTYCRRHFYLIPLIDDLHTVKTVQEVFFKVINTIQLGTGMREAQEDAEDDSNEPQNDFWTSLPGQRVAHLVSQYLPSDQICAPYVFGYFICT